jgi:hypothetical protein
MVPVRGGRATPSVKAAISVNPVVGVSAPVTAVACALARSTAGASVPVWAAATVLLGCVAAQCASCSHVVFLASLSLLSLSSSAETELSALLARRVSSSATTRMRCIRRRRCFYFYPCCCQFHHLQSCRTCRRCCSLCHRSLAFLCHGNFGLLSVLRARGDRALRLSFGHDALVRAATWERGCLRRAAARLCRRGGMSRDSQRSCCRLSTEGDMGRE